MSWYGAKQSSVSCQVIVDHLAERGRSGFIKPDKSGNAINPIRLDEMELLDPSR